MKCLEAILTADLTWNALISSVSSKVHGVLHKLRNRGWLFPIEIKFMLVQALALSNLDYACLVYNDIPTYLKLKLQRLTNADLPFVFNLRRDTSIKPYRVQLGWTTVQIGRLYFLGCEAYKVITREQLLLHRC